MHHYAEHRPEVIWGDQFESAAPFVPHPLAMVCPYCGSGEIGLSEAKSTYLCETCDGEFV